MNQSFTALIEKEGDIYVALCPEMDITSQGDSIENAHANLKEAVELFFECAPKSEIDLKLGNQVFITQMEVAVG